MKNDSTPGRVLVSLEEMAFYNTILLEVLVDLLVEKEVLNRADIIERVEKFKAEATVLGKRK